MAASMPESASAASGDSRDDGATPRRAEAGDPTLVEIPVRGMTCAACERKIKRSLERTPGVVSATVSSTRGRASIRMAGVPDRGALEEAIVASGYEVGRDRWLSSDPRVWLRAVGALVVVAVVLGVAVAAGVLDGNWSLGEPGDGGLVLIALVGVAAGFSTCGALVGGVVLAVSTAYAGGGSTGDGGGAGDRGRPAVRPMVAFQVGRIVGFFVLGAALGAVGAALVMPPLVQGALMIGVSVVMVLLGVRLLGVSPRLVGWTPRLPDWWSRKRAPGSRRRYSDLSAAGAGAATFFLPCGFTQAVQLYALTTGSPIVAGTIMAVFALGTAPGLLALSGLPALARGRWAAGVGAGIGAMLLAFAAVNVSAAASVLDLRPPATVASGTETPPQQPASGRGVSANVTLGDGYQIVHTTQDADGYQPSSTVVAAGVPIRWEITSTVPLSCAAFIRSKQLNVSVNLAEGVNTVDVPALATGEYKYDCVMGMYTGELVAVRLPGTSSAT